MLDYIINILFIASLSMNLGVLIAVFKTKRQAKIDSYVHWHIEGTRDHACGTNSENCVSLTPARVTCPKCQKWLCQQLLQVDSVSKI